MRKQFIFASILVSMLFLVTQVAQAQTSNIADSTGTLRTQFFKDQVDILNETNNKILNTIYWALGGLVTVLLAIVGLNFFQNFSFNKKKLDAIKDELSTKSEEGLKQLKIQNDNHFKTLSLNNDAKIKTGIQASIGSLESKIKELREDYEGLLRDQLIRSAFEHKTKKEMGYIFNLIRVLEIDIKKDWDYRINETLGYISDCLDEGYKGHGSLPRLQEVLDKLPKKYSVQKTKIEAKMSS